MSALSKEDIRFFKREGYLIKRGILDIELMACAREAFWAAAPPQLKRDAPDTWSLPLPECRELHSHMRGIYATFPEGDHPSEAPTCHCEGHPFHLGVVGYIDRVLPEGGGLKVWPGSHQRCYYDFDGRYAATRDERYTRDTAYFDQLPYVDFHGEAGDIIFWHHRLAHSGGHNYSRQIRLALFYDFIKDDMEEKLDMPPAEDMWEDWSEEVRTCE